MGNAYTYYSYEEYGRGYIGARSKSPIGDDTYFGTFSDTNFNPTQKIILGEYETMEEALAAEVSLHAFFDVDVNAHFANKAKQTSSGFYFDPTGREVTEAERKKSRAAWTPERRKAQAERLTTYNKSEEHRKSVVERNKKHRPFGNKSRTGMTNSLELNKKISDGSKGHKKSSTTRGRMSVTATGRRAITDGTNQTWLHPGSEMPKGWRYGTKPKG